MSFGGDYLLVSEELFNRTGNSISMVGLENNKVITHVNLSLRWVVGVLKDRIVFQDGQRNFFVLDLLSGNEEKFSPFAKLMKSGSSE